MDNVDRLVVLMVISSVVICLVWQHGKDHKIGAHPDLGKVNTSEKHGVKRGPAYLLSNLPIARNYNDALPIAGDFPSC